MRPDISAWLASVIASLTEGAAASSAAAQPSAPAIDEAAVVQHAIFTLADELDLPARRISWSAPSIHQEPWREQAHARVDREAPRGMDLDGELASCLGSRNHDFASVGEAIRGARFTGGLHDIRRMLRSRAFSCSSHRLVALRSLFAFSRRAAPAGRGPRRERERIPAAARRPVGVARSMAAVRAKLPAERVPQPMAQRRAEPAARWVLREGLTPLALRMQQGRGEARQPGTP